MIFVGATFIFLVISAGIINEWKNGKKWKALFMLPFLVPFLFVFYVFITLPERKAISEKARQQWFVEFEKKWGDEEKFTRSKWRNATPEERGKMAYDLLTNRKNPECCFNTLDVVKAELSTSSTVYLSGKYLFCYYIGTEKCKTKSGDYKYKYAMCLSTYPRGWALQICLKLANIIQSVT